MINVHQLTTDELKSWDELVVSSPQASLFHTSAWNQMLRGINEHEKGTWVPLICEDKGTILGGIALQLSYLGGRKHHASHFLGYNGPILNGKIDYQDRAKTSQGYEVMTGLLKKITDIIDHATIKNQPEIWDARPYLHLDWKVKTNFTHLWFQPNLDKASLSIDTGLHEQVNSSGKLLSIRSELNEAEIQRFSNPWYKFSILHPIQSSKDSCSSPKVISLMLEKGWCVAVAIHDNNGEKLAESLIILSRENRTIYFWRTIYLDKGQVVNLLPALLWQTYLKFGKEYNCIDLGESSNQADSQLKDRLGCKPTPIYIAKYPFL